MQETTTTKKAGWWHYAWIVLIATVIMNFFYSVSYSSFSLYAASIYERFPDMSRTSYSFVATMHSVSATVFLLLYGRIVKKLGLRLTTLVGGLGIVVGYWIYSVSSNIVMFYIGACFVGMFPAFCSSTTTAALFNKWFGKLHSTLVAISMTIGGFGGTVGSILVGRWLDSIGYVASFRYIAILQLVITVVVFLLVRNAPEDKKTGVLWAADAAQTSDGGEQELPGLTKAEAMKTYNYWAIFGFFALFAAAFYAAYANVAVYMADLGWTATTYGAIFSMVATVNNITMIPGGFAADKLGARLTLIIIVIVYAAVCFVLGFTTPGVGMMYIVCSLIGFSYLFCKVLPTSMALQAFGAKEFASIQSSLTAAVTIGAIVGIPGANVVYDLTGSYAGIFKALVAVIAVCAVLGFTGCKKARGW